MNTNIGLIGKKIGMSHFYDEKGNRHAISIIHSPDCRVAAVRALDKDGYCALQLCIDRKKDKNVSKPLKNQFKVLGYTPRLVREFRMSEAEIQSFKVGDPITVGIFKTGQYVNVKGRTIGKGFQGVMKRYAFGGFEASHGTHESFRGGGSVGARTWPARIYKGRKMPGHMGHKVRSQADLEVLAIDAAQSLLLIKGSVPDPENNWVEVRLSSRRAGRSSQEASS